MTLKSKKKNQKTLPGNNAHKMTNIAHIDVKGEFVSRKQEMFIVRETQRYPLAYMMFCQTRVAFYFCLFLFLDCGWQNL